MGPDSRLRWKSTAGQVAPDHEHRHDEDEYPYGRDVGGGDQHDGQVDGGHGHVAVGQVDDLHDAEHERQPAGEQGEEPA